MPLISGQRIHGSDRDVYVVGECVSPNGPTSLHSAQKVFFNYRLEEDEFYEANSEEWIEVRVRAVDSPGISPSPDGDRARERLLYEATSVLGRIPGWLPEPVDWLESDEHIMLVMSAPHGQTLREWRRQNTPSALSLRIAGAVLNLIDAVHRNGQVLGPFGPEDFQIDESARIFFTSTDRVTPIDRRISPPAAGTFDRVPVGFVALEALTSNDNLSQRTDLYSWASLFAFLMTDWHGATRADSHVVERFRKGLEDLSQSVPNTLRAMSPRTDRRPITQVTNGWVNTVQCALSDDPLKRPASVDAVWRSVMPRSPLALLARLWRRN